VVALVAGLAVVSAVNAQSARFTWKQGQMLVYRVEHVQSATDVSDDGKGESSSKLQQTRCWKVLEVDAAGVASLQMWVAQMRFERTAPDGETQVYDSADPDKSNPQMREQLGKFVNQTLAVLRVDSRGKVVEVKHSQGPASRYESELPFLVVLPEEALKPEQAWQRSYTVVLDPPAGTGEKYAAEQKYVCKRLDGGLATIGLSTAFKTLPPPAEQIHVLDKQPAGELVFDTVRGCLKSALLSIDKEVKNHQGEGSSYHYKSTYTIEQVESN